MNRTSHIRLQERYGGHFIAQRDGKAVASSAIHRASIKSFGKKCLNREGLVFSYIHPKHAACIYPVPQNAPCVSAEMNVLNFPRGKCSKATHVSPWYGVYSYQRSAISFQQTGLSGFLGEG